MRRSVTTLDNIDRIPAPDPDDLDHRFVRTGTPVVLTGLFSRAAVRRFADPQIARAELGHLPLPATPEPVDEAVHGRDTPPRTMAFAELYDELTAAAARAAHPGQPGPGTRPRRVCVEHDTPPPLAAAMPPPYLGLGMPQDPWISYMFLAGPGNVTHLHYDRDLRNVVMVQVFGHKRYVLIDAAETRKLVPGASPDAPYASGLYLQHFSPAELGSFLRYTNAWDCVLGPGEALLIPATTWHYVEYLDVALSVSFRLRRNPYLERLAASVPRPSVELQALATCFRDDRAVTPAARDAFDALVAAAQGGPGGGDRTARLDRLCLELCRRLGLPIAAPPYDVTDRARRDEIADAARTVAPTRPPARRRGGSGRAVSSGWW